MAYGVFTPHLLGSKGGAKGFPWTGRVLPEANTWRSVAFGNGIFVAVSQDGASRVMTSTDGITWTISSASQANAWRGVAFGNDVFVAVAQAGTNRVMTSPDGITWTNRSASQANAWVGVRYIQDKFVAIATGGTNRIMTSLDGVTWTNRTPPAQLWYDVAGSNSLMMVISYAGTVATSPDGVTWTNRTAPFTQFGTGLAFGNGVFVAVDATGGCRTSDDGITWSTAVNVGAANKMNFCDGIFIKTPQTGGQFGVSVDGVSWSMYAAPSSGNWLDVAYGNGILVATALDGTYRIATAP